MIEHAGKRLVERRQQGLLAQGRAYLRSNNIGREHMEAGEIRALLELVDHPRIRNPVQLVDAAKDAAEVLVAVRQNGLRLLGVFLRGSAACARQVLKSFELRQKLRQGSLAGIVQIQLALIRRPGRGVVSIQSPHDSLPPHIERRLLGFI